MTMDVFGEPTAPKGERPLKVLWPLRCANTIEGELLGLLGEAMAREDHRAPMIWAEDDQWNSEAYADYGKLTAFEAIALRDIVQGEITARFRRQLIVAHELGASATLDLYFVACEAEGIDPILTKGNSHGFHT